MLNHYKILTITHRDINLNELGEYMVSHNDEAELKEKLELLKTATGIEELQYLSTCNRVQYFFYTEQNLDVGFVQSFFKKINPDLTAKELKELSKNFKRYKGEAALSHLCEVASSIDSLVLGEREILRQLREAYERAKTWKLSGDHIRLAMKLAVQNGKQVYATTKIGEKAISVVSLAIKKLLKSGISKTARILLVGAGQTNQLVVKFLIKHGFSNIVVFNRNVERAKQLAALASGDGYSLTELKNYENGFDCLIVCTGATKAIINDGLYASLLRGESDEKLVIDLSIPHNVAESISSKFKINYIEVEGLKNLAKNNLAFRKNEVATVKKLIAKNISAFRLTYQRRQIEKALREVPKEISAVKSHALENVFKKELDNLDEKSRELLERMMDYMEKRCISIPMQAAKKSIG